MIKSWLKVKRRWHSLDSVSGIRPGELTPNRGVSAGEKPRDGVLTVLSSVLARVKLVPREGEPRLSLTVAGRHASAVL